MNLEISSVSRNRLLSKALRKVRQEADMEHLNNRLKAYSETNPLDGEMCLVIVDGTSGYKNSVFEDGRFFLEYAISEKNLLEDQITEVKANLPLAIKETIIRYGYTPVDRDEYLKIVESYFA